jgi:hypothetical protein
MDGVQTQLFDRGVEYIQRMQSLLPDPHMVDVMANVRDRSQICLWIGTHIAAINLLLQSYIKACHECFEIGERRSIDIFALPFAPSVGLDGFCNLSTTPISIFVDIGRVAPADWRSLVVHEYAHAHLGYAGHDHRYARTLHHLCLGLALPQPLSTATPESLRYWPPYAPIVDRLAFWRGEILDPQFMQKIYKG